MLLDSGSELSYISERCVKALGLARTPSGILVTGISSIKAETTRGCSTLDLQSGISDHTMKVRAHVLSKITSTLARHDIAASALKAFAGFELADSDYQSLAPVDILLGSDYVWTVFTGQKMFDNQGNVIAISTMFGWLEDVNQDFHGKPEDDEVEQHFVRTYTRDSKGRYIVEPPFKNSKEQFSAILQGALTRFRENHGKEEVKTTALTAQETCSLSPIEALTQRVSSWTKLVHVVAYALRFIQKTKAIKTATLANGKMLTFEEIQAARILCLQEAQKCFMENRKLLTENKPLHSRSQLVKLSPIICKDGLLRSYRITRMILEHEHTTNLHPGVSALFVIVRQKYWIFGARNLIRNLVHNCIKCFRQRKLTEHQFMADLPGIRITEALPFQRSGCDCAGPFILKERRGRNPRKTKGYICLFVCLMTSAIHLQLATDLSTDTFLACLWRFMSLRGKCSQIFSDNGTNFVGAKRALDEMQQLLSSQEHQRNLTQSLANDGIKSKKTSPFAKLGREVGVINTFR
ncbi:uncharacterized protein [Drosophila suzukii]|uniref:Integrase zinc-binding domain-containing protein n=1 Tax=Drosophila suzukii TaxID=28584 RepID=A0ABM4TXT4_DROSZ